ncbi:MAG: DUF1893 domain-containing protein [Dehalococcoidales bacterium]
MQLPLFNEFLESGETLRVYQDDELLFSSDKDGLMALLEYLDTLASSYRQVVNFDKVMGNAAALLSVRADCREVYSPLGSQLAIETLEKHGIKHHITELVPYIQQANRIDMCPMEKLSLDKGPDEFYQAIRKIIKVN